MLIVVWVYVAFFFAKVYRQSKVMSGKRPQLDMYKLDHSASSPSRSCPSRRSSSMPFVTDCKGESRQILVAIGIRVRRKSSSIKTGLPT
jgi:hypothetical protein